jgi:hypothetical protein
MNEVNFYSTFYEISTFLFKVDPMYSTSWWFSVHSREIDYWPLRLGDATHLFLHVKAIKQSAISSDLIIFENFSAIKSTSLTDVLAFVNKFLTENPGFWLIKFNLNWLSVRDNEDRWYAIPVWVSYTHVTLINYEIPMIN